MQHTLQKNNIPPPFINASFAKYSSSMATLSLNGVFSAPYKNKTGLLIGGKKHRLPAYMSVPPSAPIPPHFPAGRDSI